MRKSTLRLFTVAFCTVPLLTASAVSAAPPSQPSQQQVMDQYNQQKFSSGNQNTTSPSNTTTTTPNQTVKAAPTYSGKSVGRADMAGNTPLHNAAYKGDTAAITELLDVPGAQIDVPEKRGLTPLMLAAGGNHPEAVKLLLARGANPNLHSKEGLTALLKASSAGNLAEVDMLLKAGADPNAKDIQGRTAAQLADHYRQGDWSEVCDRLKAASAPKN